MAKKISFFLFLVFVLITFVPANIIFSDDKQDQSFADALTLIDDGNYADALQILIKIEDNSPEMKHVIANCYAREEVWEEAAKYYKQAISTEYALSDYSTYHLARCYQILEDYEKSVKYYQRLVNHYPNSPHFSEAKFQIAVVHWEQKHYQKSIQFFADLANEKGGSYIREATFKMARIYEDLQDWQKAKALYDKLISRNTSDQIAFASLNRLEKSVLKSAELRVARKQLMDQGGVLYNNLRLTGALKKYRKVVKGYQDELTTQAFYQIGKTYFRQRKYSRAITEFQKIKDYMAGPGYFTSALYQIGRCHRRLNQHQTARKHFNSFARKYHWSKFADDALYHQARLYEVDSDAKTAVKLYQKMIGLYRYSELVPRAYWRIGWIRFKAKQYGDSITIFQKLVSLFPNSGWALAADYWIAKVHEKQKNWGKAKHNYQKIRESDKWYYGNLAGHRIESRTNINSVPNQRASEKKDWENIGMDKTTRVERLMYLKLYVDAVTELKTVIKIKKSNRRDDYYNLIVCYQRLEDFKKAHYYAEILSKFWEPQSRDKIPEGLLRMLYPLHYKDQIAEYAAEYKIDPFFVASMIREESRYNPSIISPAGACGLMQIMPQTGRYIAKQIKMRPFHREMLFLPAVNIRLGTWYMKNLMDQFENSMELASGAYNGGVNRIKRWQKEMKATDIEEFIEDIPIDETRRHIKKVIDSYYTYKELYSEFDSQPDQKS
ncbi:TPA: tetratricopeptide repeat protein [Candidatus Poribacteria bacterium]|nr:tetratricopeptide repeat protein [Candidatus Poribacteria bacterium]